VCGDRGSVKTVPFCTQAPLSQAVMEPGFTIVPPASRRGAMKRTS
jgi:hypothetical protein